MPELIDDELQALYIKVGEAMLKRLIPSKSPVLDLICGLPSQRGKQELYDAFREAQMEESNRVVHFITATMWELFNEYQSKAGVTQDE